MEELKKLLSFVPGFRSGVVWKKIIASIYYIMTLFMITSGLGMFLVGISLPFFLFYFTKAAKNRGKKETLTVILSFMLMVIGSNIMPTESTITSSNISVDNGKENNQSSNESQKESKEAEKNSNTTNTSPNSSVNGELKVHFIDVGQADSILIQQGSSAMLIDGGNDDDKTLVKSYIEEQGINKLDVVIATHGHEDHLGGLDYIINAFQIGKVYYPQGHKTTTKNFEEFVTAVKNKGLKLTNPTVGESFKIGEATVTILAPNSSSYEDANDYSIVTMLQYGDNRFLFTGDAEAISENEMLNKGFDLKADVLKVGHHGSRSSTTANFLKAVSPKYAVISVGKDNSYGHPVQSTLDRLKRYNVELYRTDESGTIVATSNGKNIIFNTKPGNYNGAPSASNDNNSSTSNNNSKGTEVTNNAQSNSGVSTKEKQSSSSGEKQYIDSNGNGLIKGNASSKIYHLPGGAFYDKTKAEVWFKTESEAQKAGYRRSSN